MSTLAIYLSVVLATIVPSMKEERRASIASDIATVTLAEERIFDNDVTGQKTALLLVSIAHHETGRSWAKWVDNGNCNDPEWREKHAALMKGGDCDGGKAWSIFQVHVPDDSVEAGHALIADRKNAVRAALTIARESLKSGTGLCHYLGETYPRCPRARLRLVTLAGWIEDFPWHPEDEHVTTGIE